MKRRLDQALVDRGLAGSLQQAAGLVLAGRVFSKDRRLDKLGITVRPDEPLRVRGLHLYVSRGGEKLAAALAGFAVKVSGRVALDCGAATGGFTDCLLQAGARLVYAVDVGRGQLHWRLGRDPRVRDLGGTNLSEVGALVPPPGLLTLDLSYLSLRVAIPEAVRLLDPTDRFPEVIALVKPLFELRANRMPSGPAAYRQVLTGLVEAFVSTPFPVHDLIRSPLPGRSGTVEFFLHLRPGGPPALDGRMEAALAGL